MNFKLVVLTFACLTIYVQPARGDFSGLTNAIEGLFTIFPSMLIDKTKSVGKAAADMASIATMGTGIEVSELGKAAASFKGAVADGLYSIGNTISKAGNTITENLNYKPQGRVVVEGYDPCPVNVAPCDQEVVQFKARPSKHIYDNPPLLWRILRNGSKTRAYRGRNLVNYKEGVARNVPVVYEIINTPRVYPGPRGTFYIQKK